MTHLTSCGVNVAVSRDGEKHIYAFIARLKAKWRKAGRHAARFLSANKDWLDANIIHDSMTPSSSTQQNHRGRPKIPFGEKSERAKRLATDPLTQHTPEKLIHAAKRRAQSDGRRDLAYVLAHSNETPKRARKVRRMLSVAPKPPPKKLTDDQGLALFIDSRYSKASWQNTRLTLSAQNSDVFPSYNHLRSAKEKCYPAEITITGERAEAPLQSLLAHTAARLVELQEPVIRQVAGQDGEVSLQLICKWGYVGSSSQSQYKQGGVSDDGQILHTSLVPLQLLYGNSVVWQNRTPSSTRFCRPLKLEYVRETKEVNVREDAYWKDQVSELQPHIVRLVETEMEAGHLDVIITFRLLETMIDGKVHANVTGTSTQCCTVCKASPKQMNDIEEVRRRDVDSASLLLGLSTMHAWIRFFEAVVHLSYKLETKKWRTVAEEDKKQLATKKKNSRYRTSSGSSCISMLTSRDREAARPTTETRHSELFKRRRSSPTSLAWIKSSSIACT